MQFVYPFYLVVPNISNSYSSVTYCGACCFIFQWTNFNKKVLYEFFPKNIIVGSDLGDHPQAVAMKFLGKLSSVQSGVILAVSALCCN